MRALVTGGAGFIGSHVATALVANDWEVAIVDDLSSGARANVPDGAELHVLDIRDGEGVTRVFEQFRPDVVCHHAAQASVSVSTREPLFDAQVNVLGSLHLLAASAACKVSRFVFASTGGAIYGEVPEGQRAALSMRPAPASPYACSKYSVEVYLESFRQQHGLPYTILRYANVYGPRQNPHGEAGVVAIFSNLLLDRKQALIFGDGSQTRDFVFVGDVVRAIIAALADGNSRLVANIGTGGEITVLELARTIVDLCGNQSTIAHAPPRAGEILKSRARVDRMRDALGVVAKTKLVDGLRATVSS